MNKRLLTLMLALILVFSAMTSFALAQTDYNGNPIPASLEKPVSISVRRVADHEGLLRIRVTQPQSIMDMFDDDYVEWSTAPIIELDFKINNGNWYFNRSPGPFRELELDYYYEERYPEFSTSSIILHPAYTIHDEHNAYDIDLYNEFIGLDSWDLDNSTYYFRYRYVYDYSAYDESADLYGYKDVVSPWSDIAAIGKEATGKIPTALDAPVNLAGELKKYDDGRPYFYFTHTTPDSVITANKSVEIIATLDWKIGEGLWASEGAGDLFDQPGNVLMSTMEFNPVVQGFDDNDVEENTWYFRMCYTFERQDGSRYLSPFSNAVTIGVDAWSKASSWALGELKKAQELGLIPASLAGSDLTKPITRAEFAAVSVKVYEALAQTATVPVSVNPFSDTTDIEVLKAYNVGITDGVGGGKFDPNELLPREQAATMLTRVFKKYSMSGWTLKTDSQFILEYTKPANFTDDAKISSWAKDSVYFMAAHEIIKGTGNNMFSPRATTSAEVAINYASATREQALLIAVRMIENLK